MATAVIVGLIIYGILAVIGGICYWLSQQVPPIDDGTLYMGLSPGIETFTIKPLTKGEPYKVTLSGFYHYGSSWNRHQADGCYKGQAGNFIERSRKLYFDGTLVDIEPFEEDRFLHSYGFQYTGTGQRLSILLYPPCKNNGAPIAGSLLVAIAPLSDADRLAVDEADRQRLERIEQARLAEQRQKQAELRLKRRQEQEEQSRQLQEQARRVLEEERQKREAQARQEEYWRACRKDEKEKKRAQDEKRKLELQEQLKRLRIRSHLERNVLDEKYRDNLATHHREKVIASKPVIIEGYSEFMANDDLLQLARQEAPEVLDFMEALVELVQLAERKAAEPQAKALPPAPPPRIKMTENEVRARKVHRKSRMAADVAMEKLTLLDKTLEFKETLERYPLDEDEKMRQVRDYYDDISGDDRGNGKKLD